MGRAIAEGASGYVGKEKPIVEIVEMLDRASAWPARGRAVAAPARPLRPQKSTDDPLWALQFLTDREWQVMRCIMDGQTTEEMATSLGVPAEHRARTHVQNLLTKLGVHSRLQAAALMSAHGSHESWPAHLR